MHSQYCILVCTASRKAGLSPMIYALMAHLLITVLGSLPGNYNQEIQNGVPQHAP